MKNAEDSPLLIGTRGSKLALAQANLVKNLLGKNGVRTGIKIIKTCGDTFTDRPLHEVQGFGVFVREIDDAIVGGSRTRWLDERRAA